MYWQSALGIDPVAGAADVTTMTGLSGDEKWSGGVPAANGLICKTQAISTTTRFPACL